MARIDLRLPRPAPTKKEKLISACFAKSSVFENQYAIHLLCNRVIMRHNDQTGLQLGIQLQHEAQNMSAIA